MLTSLYKFYCYSNTLISKSLSYISNPSKDIKTQRLKETNKNIVKNLYDFSYSMTEIIPRVYLGNAYNARDYYSLKNKNIKLIVNCTKEFPNNFENEFQYINVSILDENNTDISSYFDSTTDKINEVLTNDPSSTILIHCFMGASRSVAILISYMIKYHNITVDAAIDYIEKRRYFINLNIDFYFQLLEYQMKKNLIHSNE
jgi:protein-tyrosine phosphatase